MINQVILVCVVIIVDSYKFVTDNNYTKIVDSTLMNGFIFSNDIRDIQKEAKELSIPILIGKLGNNIKAQQDFNIKRYPYFGISLRLEQKIQIIYYGLPDIVTQQTMIKLIEKHLRFINRQGLVDENNFSVSFQQQKLQNIGIQKDMLKKYFYLSPTYYPIQFSYNGHLQFQGKNNIKINNQFKQISNYQQLNHILIQLVFQKIPQFKQNIYSNLLQFSQNPTIYLLILDSFNSDKRQSSLQLKNKLTTITKEYLKENILIFWIQSRFNIKKKQFLGFQQQDDPPLFALFDVSQKRKKFIPSQTILNIEIVKQFIQNNIQKDKDDKQYEIVKQKLSKRNIGNRIENENYLIMVSSEYNEEQIQICEYIVKRINRFLFDKSLKLIIPKQYKYESKTYKKGIFIIFQNQQSYISQNIQICQELKNNIQNSLTYNKLPPNWCIMEDNMRQYFLQK